MQQYFTMLLKDKQVQALNLRFFFVTDAFTVTVSRWGCCHIACCQLSVIC
jgi:hypothetical protein